MFLMAAGLLMIAAGIIWRNWRRSRETLQGHTTARVIRLLPREDLSGRTSQFKTEYYPVFEFYADSKRYSEVYPFGSYPSKYKVGQQLQIDYDPANPGDFEIHDRTLQDMLPALTYYAGVIFTSAGAVLFLVFAART